jgi:hypothetical protein
MENGEHVFFLLLDHGSVVLTNLFLGVSPVCDSYVRPETLVRICDECNFGTYGGRCIICGSPGEYFFSFSFIISPTSPIRSLGCSLTFCSLLTYVFFPFLRLI